jgi:hypothetical protein
MRDLRAIVPVLLVLAAGGAAWAQSRVPEGRWRAEERCGRDPPRSFVLSSDGTMLTARAPGRDVNSFGAILGFAPLLPGGRFAIDITLGSADGKSSYTGRVHENRTITTDGGSWSGSSFTPCQVSATWIGPIPTAGARASGPTTAGRPEPIPRQPGGGSSAGRPEPVPSAPRESPAAASRLPVCDEDGPAPSALGADGQWRPTCTPRGATAVSRPAAAPTPAARPTTPTSGGQSEADILRRQLEEERQRREAAERALRLNDALGRQGRN